MIITKQITVDVDFEHEDIRELISSCSSEDKKELLDDLGRDILDDNSYAVLNLALKDDISLIIVPNNLEEEFKIKEIKKIFQSCTLSEIEDMIALYNKDHVNQIREHYVNI